MAYNPNIPVVTNYMTTSQRQIQSNFQIINSIFSKNHVPLNSDTPGNLQGMHDIITLRVSDNDPTTTSDQVALYTKLVNNVPTLFYRPNSDQTPIEMTYPSISTGLQSSDPDVYKSQQYSFLAGPFVFYIGSVLASDGDTVMLTPSTTLIYVGLVDNGGQGSDKNSVCPTNISANQFDIRLPSGLTAPVAVFYLAIGKP